MEYTNKICMRNKLKLFFQRHTIFVFNYTVSIFYFLNTLFCCTCFKYANFYFKTSQCVQHLCFHCKCIIHIFIHYVFYLILFSLIAAIPSGLVPNIIIIFLAVFVVHETDVNFRELYKPCHA